MRWVFLLVGLAIGFALGYAVRDERPERGSRSDELPERTRERPESDPARSVETQGPAHTEAEAPVGARESQPQPIQPSQVATQGGQEGWGRVIVDFSGTETRPGVTVVGRDIFGAETENTQEPGEDGRTSLAVRAGTFLVWWPGEGGERIGVRVRVVAGRVTLVRVADGARLPTPEGLGRVLAYVESVDGGPQAGASVGILGDGDLYSEGGSIRTGQDGRCVFEVIPGRYRMLLGGAERDVTVVAEEEATVRFRHENEGDVIVRGAPPRTSFALRREEPEEREDERERSFESAGEFLYVPAGTYRLTAFLHPNASDRRDLGRVRVEARVRTEVDARLPKGGLRIRVLVPGLSRRAPVIVALRATEAGMLPQRLDRGIDWNMLRDAEFWGHEFVALSRGAYVVRVTADGREPVERRVEMGDEVVVLEVTLPR